MILNINFEGSGVFDKPLNKEVNGLINRCLGENNKYHGKFSNYCISSMQGGKMNKEGLIMFSDGAYIQVSSNDKDFINDLVSGIITNGDKLSIASLRYKNFDVDGFEPFEKFDIIRTISPLYLSDKGRSLTFKDDNVFIVSWKNIYADKTKDSSSVDK